MSTKSSPGTLLGDSSEGELLTDVDDLAPGASSNISRQNLPSLHLALKPLNEAKLQSTYGAATKRLFLFDYDGTLTDIVAHPAKAVIPDNIKIWLETLASEPKNVVWVISGRDQAFLEQHLGHLHRIGLVAEHGAFSRPPNDLDWQDIAAYADMGWRAEVYNAFKDVMKYDEGVYIEVKRVALVLHYRLARDLNLAARYVADCKTELERNLAGRWPVDFVTGKCVLEARPRHFHKGGIVHKILKGFIYARGELPDFVLCCGDDVTDEDMFHALHCSDVHQEKVFTIRIGESTNNTEASWYLAGPTMLFAVIKSLNAREEAENPRKGCMKTDESHKIGKVIPVS